MKHNISLYFLFFLASILISCNNIVEEKYQIDKETYSSKYKGHRVRYIIIHYTYLDDEGSIEILTQKPVSTHYLITTDHNEPIYQLVDENDRAWHAGISDFDGRKAINDSSIGIEIVHQGRLDDDSDEIQSLETEQRVFIPPEMYIDYDKKQLDKLVFLLQKIISKYNIHPANIIGHSDVAPTRKQDPGPKFPWKWLYDQYGIGMWYDIDDYNYFMESDDYSKASIEDIKKEFHKYGYTSMPINDKWDNASRLTLYAFQSHFRQEKPDGNMDLETYAIIKSLNKKLETIDKDKYFVKVDIK